MIHTNVAMRAKTEETDESSFYLAYNKAINRLNNIMSYDDIPEHIKIEITTQNNLN